MEDRRGYYSDARSRALCHPRNQEPRAAGTESSSGECSLISRHSSSSIFVACHGLRCKIARHSLLKKALRSSQVARVRLPPPVHAARPRSLWAFCAYAAGSWHPIVDICMRYTPVKALLAWDITERLDSLRIEVRPRY